MIYLDGAATSLPKAPGVARAMVRALTRCGNPGRGGHRASMEAARTVFACRELAARLFHCREEQVIFTQNCTHGLNIAISSLVKPGDRVVVSGFEHNAVMRPLYALGANISVAGRKLFDPEDTLREFQKALKGAKAAVFTHASNVFGYVLPVKAMAGACRAEGVPFVIDGAQAAGAAPIDFESLGADFLAVPGHKGLLGPQGTGLLLCKNGAEPLIFGGTGTHSRDYAMPPESPERLEAGTLNVPGIAGLAWGLAWVLEQGPEAIGRREAALAAHCAQGLREVGAKVFCGPGQGGVLSFQTGQDPETVAEHLASQGIAVRAGLHCAPLAHESAGTLETGTVRLSFGPFSYRNQADMLIRVLKKSDVM